MWIMKWATVIPQLPIHIGLQMFVHSFYWRFVGDWPGTTVLTSVDHLNQIARNNRLEIGEKLQLSNSGWHLTWFLQPSDWVKKMDGYSHFDWSKPHFKELSWIEVSKRRTLPCLRILTNPSTVRQPVLILTRENSTTALHLILQWMTYLSLYWQTKTDSLT